MNTFPSSLSSTFPSRTQASPDRESLFLSASPALVGYDGESNCIVLIYPRVRLTCLGKWKVASFYANEVPGRYDSKKFGGEEQEVFLQFKLSQGKASHEEHGGGVEWTEEER